MTAKLIQVALILALATTIFLWIRSHIYMESIIWGYPSGQRQITSDAGILFFCDWANNKPASTGLSLTFTQYPATQWTWLDFGEISTKILGFLYKWRSSTDPMLQIGIPHWFVAFLVGCPLSYLTIQTRKLKKRKIQNLCIHCGYNLTGNTSGTCPECGECI